MSARVMRALAIPAIPCGLALLGLDLYLMERRQSEHWRAAVVAQAAVGSAQRQSAASAASSG